MYCKLALRNVKKSYRDFFIYFLTLAFSIALFYVFTSFEAQSEIIQLDPSQGSMVASLVQVMKVMSYIFVVVFAFLILYANNFLIKRRKKELGMYTMLGMPRRTISRVLIYETLYIGIFSLVFGIGLGILLSQGTSILSAKLLAVSMNYRVVFSLPACLQTIGFFAVIFFIVMIFNGILLKRYKLIDLLKASRKNETSRVQSWHVSLLVLIIACLLLGYAYNLALKQMELLRQMPIIILIGSLGTFALFLALSGFMLRLMKRGKRRYFKDLNVFTMRQVSAKISTTYKMMSVVCLMLLLAIGGLATSFNLNHVLSSQLKGMTPYDISVLVIEPDSPKFEQKFETVSGISQARELNVYDVGIVMTDWMTSVPNTTLDFNQMGVSLIGLSDYNAARKVDGFEPIQLDVNALYFQSQFLPKVLAVHKLDASILLKDSITLQGQNFKIAHDLESEPIRFATGNANVGAYFVVHDQWIPTIQQHLVHGDFNSNLAIYNVNVENDIEGVAKQMNEILDGQEMGAYSRIETRQEVEGMMRGTSLLFTYVGLFMGSVFLLSSVVVLALQQLSEASDNQKRYEVLLKIGASEKQIKRSIRGQITLYFMLPLAIALIHSVVGITALNGALKLGGLEATTMLPALLTTGSILIVYGIYYWITVSGSYTIVFHKKR